MELATGKRNWRKLMGGAERFWENDAFSLAMNPLSQQRIITHLNTVVSSWDNLFYARPHSPWPLSLLPRGEGETLPASGQRGGALVHVVNGFGAGIPQSRGWKTAVSKASRKHVSEMPSHIASPSSALRAPSPPVGAKGCIGRREPMNGLVCSRTIFSTEQLESLPYGGAGAVLPTGF